MLRRSIRLGRTIATSWTACRPHNAVSARFNSQAAPSSPPPPQRQHRQMVNQRQKQVQDSEQRQDAEPSENAQDGSAERPAVEEEASTVTDENPPEVLPTTTEFEFAPEEDHQRYYHYFDTHKIYSGLKYAGFSEGQAETLMLTIRDMLSRKLVQCKEMHPLISQVDNDAYLFDAACSEIRNEIQMTRQSQNEEYRSNLARLQRDVEILQQELNEYISNMKSEIDMDMNERKNSTRVDESIVEMKIQELNNKITIDLSSEVKSNIEALRWQTTRRGLLAVLIIAFGIMMATSATKKEEQKVRRREPHRPLGTEVEFSVPVLTTSEMDDSPLPDPPIERL